MAYRHEVFQDLLVSDELRRALAEFVAGVRDVDERLEHASTLAYPFELQRWQLDAAGTYRTAVAAVVNALETASLGSRALVAVRARLREYADSEAYTALDSETVRTLADLAGVTYRMRIGENRIVVAHDGEPDYGGEVLATFARFRPPTMRPRSRRTLRRARHEPLVEIEILMWVARLHPAVFRGLAAFAQQHAAFVDPAIESFADELPVDLAWLDLIEPIRDAGLPFCFPECSGERCGLCRPAACSTLPLPGGGSRQVLTSSRTTSS